MSENIYPDIPVCTEIPNDLEIIETTYKGYIVKTGYDSKQDVVYLIDCRKT